MGKNLLTVTDIEFGYGFLTVWCIEYPLVREVAAETYPHLPDEVQRYNPKSLWFHNPQIFHPHGQGPETGRKYFKHFHVVYPHIPSETDCKALWEALVKTGRVAGGRPRSTEWGQYRASERGIDQELRISKAMYKAYITGYEKRASKYKQTNDTK